MFAVGSWGAAGKVVHVPPGQTKIAAQAFRCDRSLAVVHIPDSVTSIGGWAFMNCSSLAEVHIPDSVTSIGREAFINCSSLAEVHIPDSVTSIGQAAFFGCSSLAEVHIPGSVTSIGGQAFQNCSSLSEVRIPDSVTIIGWAAFHGCSALAEVNVPASASICEYGHWPSFAPTTRVVRRPAAALGGGPQEKSPGAKSQQPERKDKKAMEELKAQELQLKSRQCVELEAKCRELQLKAREYEKLEAKCLELQLKDQEREELKARAARELQLKSKQCDGLEAKCRELQLQAKRCEELKAQELQLKAAQCEKLEAERQGLEAKCRELQLKARGLELEKRYRESFANTYAHLHFEVDALEVLPEDAAGEAILTDFARRSTCTAEERSPVYVYHGCPPETVPLILENGLRPSHCEVCRGLKVGCCRDRGWFGDHTKGVYVSRHADYTAKYHSCPPAELKEMTAGVSGATIMFKTITGRRNKMSEADRSGVPPELGFHAHVSCSNLEYFLYDEDTMAEPPRPLRRCIPMAVIHWRAVRSDRWSIQDDGAAPQALPPPVQPAPQ